MEHLGGMQFATDSDIQHVDISWLKALDTDLFHAGIDALTSGAVGKDCQRRLLSRPRFVRAVAPRIIIIIIIIDALTGPGGRAV
jgi:hypothetical protein